MINKNILILRFLFNPVFSTRWYLWVKPALIALHITESAFVVLSKNHMPIYL